jgi:hypothetical protein
LIAFETVLESPLEVIFIHVRQLVVEPALQNGRWLKRTPRRRLSEQREPGCWDAFAWLRGRRDRRHRSGHGFPPTWH